MKLITKEIEEQLLRNGASAEENHEPVVKFFTPDAGCTWYISEMDPENPDTLFGLCDLGMGCPELGYVSLSELKAIRGKLGLPVERDRHWEPTPGKPIMEYANA